MKEMSLYVHIPFCESKCFYCNFVSCKSSKENMEKYVQFLLKEIEFNKNKNFLIKTIFIGGGTPSVLDAKLIEYILIKIRNCFEVAKNCEITIEINPNSFSKQKSEIYKKIGVNRLSFGLQSANNRLLKKINRIHTKNDFICAIKLAKNVGFYNINADILLGLPSQKMIDVKSTLKLLKKLDITHVSCYSLILEENTPLFEMVKSKKVKLVGEEKTVKMFDFCCKFLQKNKINRYEVSNFAKPSFECKHNLTYWNLENFLGLGLNAHSKIDNEEFENFSNFDEYYASIESGKKPIAKKETITKTEMQEEFVMLGLRKTQGIDLSEFKNLFKQDLLVLKQKEIEKFVDKKMLTVENNFLKATNLGFKVLNQIIVELI